MATNARAGRASARRCRAPDSSTAASMRRLRLLAFTARGGADDDPGTAEPRREPRRSRARASVEQAHAAAAARGSGKSSAWAAGPVRSRPEALEQTRRGPCGRGRRPPPEVETTNVPAPGRHRPKRARLGCWEPESRRLLATMPGALGSESRRRRGRPRRAPPPGDGAGLSLRRHLVDQPGMAEPHPAFVGGRSRLSRPPAREREEDHRERSPGARAISVEVACSSAGSRTGRPFTITTISSRLRG